jgi:uncharacterized protein YecE (DUF72 family)
VKIEGVHGEEGSPGGSAFTKIPEATTPYRVYMTAREEIQLEHFQFRDLHPNVYLGTASDRYAGWIGQIYSGERYAGRISHRSKTVGGRPFVEEVLPVDSVEEYFRHFPVLELDFTFYGPLLDKDGKAVQNLHLLSTYSRYLKTDDRLILKVPQTIFARRLRHAGTYVENGQYLNPHMFTNQFYRPVLGLVGPWLAALVFEQEYQPKQERPSPRRMADELDAFFNAIPKDHRYHVELRTDTLWAPPLLDVMERHGVGQVLSHWTWLPSLSRQFMRSRGKFLNKGKTCVIRLMTPRGMRYEDAYARAYPFNAQVDGMMNPEMIDDTVDIVRAAIKDEIRTHVIINNRSGGNAPRIAQRIAEKLLHGLSDG